MQERLMESFFPDPEAQKDHTGALSSFIIPQTALWWYSTELNNAPAHLPGNLLALGISTALGYLSSSDPF